METKIKEPKFNNPKVAEVAPSPEAVESITTREYSFFKNSGSKMEIPEGGGILSLAKLPTGPKATRQRTFQLWLTATELWKIRTNETTPEIEKIPYPSSNPVDFLDEYINKNIGLGAAQGTMTVSANEIANIKNAVNSDRDNHMNGKFHITTEGVVFFLPNPFKT